MNNSVSHTILGLKALAQSLSCEKDGLLLEGRVSFRGTKALGFALVSLKVTNSILYYIIRIVYASLGDGGKAGQN